MSTCDKNVPEVITISSDDSDTNEKISHQKKCTTKISTGRRKNRAKEVKIESKSRILRRAERDVKKELLTPKISNFFPKSLADGNGSIFRKVEDEPVFYYEKKKKGGNGTVTQRKCPEYKVISDTTFGVDSFRFGSIKGVTHYFLTHFHADHYIGLTKTFNQPIFMSEITGRLVKRLLNVSDKYINVIQLNQPFVINNVEITAIDANHCLGAVMFFFKLPSNKTILHTGDFRACPEMESEPVFWNNNIDLIYLDTTYLSSKYSFKSQWESVKAAQHHVLEYGEKFPSKNFLIVCGSYLIGKEKIWTNIAECFNLKVWVDSNRRKVLECINDNRMLRLLVDTQAEANLHVLPINKLHYELLVKYLSNFDQFENLLALVPSGWQINNKRPIVRGKITIIGIEYSEHSSYDELKRFVRYIRPKQVISTVPYGSDMMKTPKIPQSWINDEKLKKIGYQESITNYIQIGGSTKNNSELKMVESTEAAIDTISLCEVVLASTPSDRDSKITETIDFDNGNLMEIEKDKHELADEIDWMF